MIVCLQRGLIEGCRGIKVAQRRMGRWNERVSRSCRYKFGSERFMSYGRSCLGATQLSTARGGGRGGDMYMLCDKTETESEPCVTLYW